MFHTGFLRACINECEWVDCDTPESSESMDGEASLEVKTCFSSKDHTVFKNWFESSAQELKVVLQAQVLRGRKERDSWSRFLLLFSYFGADRLLRICEDAIKLEAKEALRRVLFTLYPPNLEPFPMIYPVNFSVIWGLRYCTADGNKVRLETGDALTHLDRLCSA